MLVSSHGVGWGRAQLGVKYRGRLSTQSIKERKKTNIVRFIQVLQLGPRPTSIQAITY